MDPRVRRIAITVFVLALAGGVVASMLLPRLSPPASPPPTAQPTQAVTQPPEPDRSSETSATRDSDPAGDTSADVPPAGEPAEPLNGLHAIAPPGEISAPGVAPQSLGSLEPRDHRMQLELSRRGAGIKSIAYSNIWETAFAKRQADAFYEAAAAGRTPGDPLPDERWRYILQTEQPYKWYDGTANSWLSLTVPLLAVYRVEINGEPVPLLKESVWSQTGPGRFETRVVDDDDTPILHITRQLILGSNYDITFEQRLTNLTERSLEVRWVQYGPPELRMDRARYIDRRRDRIAFLQYPVSYPEIINTDDNDYLFEHKPLLKRTDKARDLVDRAKKANVAVDSQRLNELLTLWPTQESLNENYELAWFAATNRYFALAVHPIVDAQGGGTRSLEDVVSEIRTEAPGNKKDPDRIAFTTLYSPKRAIAPGEESAFDLGVYAGPLDREILGKEEPFKSLHMQGLILYQMSSFCAICTFQWLAKGLLWFLSGVHFVIRDWGLAIILLVVVVRTLLHPLTKKAQVNMQRFGKVMGDLKPEIEKLQKKYKDEPKKLQQEQMRMMRERGVNPFQMLGCLPMFLQMPIWVALYAMLYFAFELRHEPALWGFFQLFWNWPFLADLSSADHFFWELDEPFNFLMWNVTGINFMPILMGLVFFFQQKYMAPPPSPSMTKEQIQQQKIMKVMMVVLFPLMLYSAPSGLTLYIFTSSLFGIIESRHIRKHIKDVDLTPPKPKPQAKRKPRDPQARAFADAIDRAKAKRRPPPKHFKKRKS
ncbi:MAG: membrane protein insertase YidC [Planctomycetes bacterium]|nr:membrane protein insertase YidC [Planctomycetota bacterium]